MAKTRPGSLKNLLAKPDGHRFSSNKAFRLAKIVVIV